jgi:hypothetical protein
MLIISCKFKIAIQWQTTAMDGIQLTCTHLFHLIIPDFNSGVNLAARRTPTSSNVVIRPKAVSMSLGWKGALLKQVSEINCINSWFFRSYKEDIVKG